MSVLYSGETCFWLLASVWWWICGSLSGCAGEMRDSSSGLPIQGKPLVTYPSSCCDWCFPRSSPGPSNISSWGKGCPFGKASCNSPRWNPGGWGTWCYHLAKWGMPGGLWLELKENESPSGDCIEPIDSSSWKLATGWTIVTILTTQRLHWGHTAPAARELFCILSHTII